MIQYPKTAIGKRFAKGASTGGAEQARREGRSRGSGAVQKGWDWEMALSFSWGYVGNKKEIGFL